MLINIVNKELPYTPFLIIGSGIAGLYTALKLAEIAEVTLITKETLAESNTAYAQGGIAAAISPSDSPQLHYEDTIKVGVGLCLPHAVQVLVEEGPERVRELLRLGVPFDRTAGKPALTREAAHSRRRILHADGDATGREISKVLTECVLRKPNIKVIENRFVVSLLTADGICHGALTIENNHRQEKGLKPILAGATILCTGGCGQVFSATTNPKVATGDGMAIAYRAGAPLTDLEFIQFHPTVLYLPPAPRFLISESVRGEGAVLRDKKGRRFMDEYHPLAELAPRDVVARAIDLELQKSNEECVFLDLSGLTPELIRKRFPNIYETCREYGLDITTEPIPVAPAAHYMMGGIATDLWGRTGLPQLFACGEVANTGVHGANRLASNSLLEGLVFGHRITEYLHQRPPGGRPDDEEFNTDLDFHTDPAATEEKILELQTLMATAMGIIRNQKDMAAALSFLTKNGWSQARNLDELPINESYLELQNMRLVAKLMIKAALFRKESRGSHYCTDWPKTDPAWTNRIFHFREEIKTIPVTESPAWSWFNRG